MNAPLLRLKARDFVRGLALFVATAIVSALATMLDSGFEAVSLSALLLTATKATVAYLGIKLATAENGKLGGIL